MDRAGAFEALGREFEPLRAHQEKRAAMGVKMKRLHERGGIAAMGLATKESSMYLHTIQAVGIFLTLLGLCIYTFHINSKLEKLRTKLENLDELFERHTHCLTCGALNNRCGCK